ncbi:MAG: hypothetical protein K0R83_3047, partial [Caulobacter sp.]|nr:hypothetical protein [Caulobacter sp.]
MRTMAAVMTAFMLAGAVQAGEAPSAATLAAQARLKAELPFA